MYITIHGANDSNALTNVWCHLPVACLVHEVYEECNNQNGQNCPTVINILTMGCRCINRPALQLNYHTTKGQSQ